MTGQLIDCSCGRRHRLTSFIPDPDRPSGFLCPRIFRKVMRLTAADRAMSDMLLAEATS